MSPDRSEKLHPGHRPPNSLDTLHLKIKPPPPPSSSVWDPVWPSVWDPESQTGQRLHTRRCKHPHRDLTSRVTNAQKLRKCTPRDKGTQSLRGAWTTVHNIHSDKISRSLSPPRARRDRAYPSSICDVTPSDTCPQRPDTLYFLGRHQSRSETSLDLSCLHG